ncbi:MULTISPECIES: thioredoxin family protein [Planktothricoides]|uniref:Thioredoxin family protein n=2 Tax=Planktothricoides raciborskii TaxID=132608 RepID=A0AAU8JMF1_9CYAN|nr:MULTISPECIES: thioredoxin family protein [Planktothricoides]KOR34526.1 redox-active disulfide protein 2 [Planktothricoides sp. SR001]MBD2547301.1 TM0996/MTH895 family glutaredoxin-like protein [Planktothricoides raciborskii FACHB-1370]MBD2585823.1 TM0996/MTH895 family glutaredoxin-like protein [Planktothricoides raciborskii FACHB-1261]
MSAIKVEVLGTGCKKCQQLEANAKEAIAALNLEAEVVHIKDPMQIVERGVMKTPALVVNDTLVSQGQVATPEQIKKYLTV